uniref:C2H2-type domain-containing protein n=1 Tax=Biomphalaria glabrata TaxID=6526 RepID=A0A2C9LXY8_BIOGL
MEDNQQHDTSGDVENTDNETVELTKGQESLTEEKRPPGFENMPTGLPPIDIHELAKVLRDPNMPSQKIMNEVADHIIKKASQKDNSSTVGDGASEGMKSVVDCIIEVCLKQDDSDDSDEDDDYYEDEKILREIPCKFCNKIFNSSMTCKTHVLVAHPQLDPSVLNIKYLSCSLQTNSRLCQRAADGGITGIYCIRNFWISNRFRTQTCQLTTDCTFCSTLN